MKLRLRSTATKETLKFEVPSDCTLPQLKHVIANRIGNASSSAPSHITVSVNRKDELIGSSDSTLQSIGVSSGDLLFYTIDFTEFVPNTLTPCVETSSFDVAMVDCGVSEPKEVGKIEPEMVDETMEVEETGDGVDDKRRDAPHFLKYVWKDGREEVLCLDGLVMVAVQAVLVDAGFVRLDLESAATVYEFQIPDADKLAKPLTLRYTLGEIEQYKSVGCEFVTVRMYKQGRVIFVYGDMIGNKNGCYVLKLDEARYGKCIEMELRRREESGGDSGGGAGMLLSYIQDSEVFRFYKEVKDKLALPLLIDICDKAGLQLPPCLMLLPTELKIKILELVSGTDLATLACQCSELRYLTSDNSLWKMKYVEEFGNGGRGDSTNWKRKFISSWKTAREIKRVTDREDLCRFNQMNCLNNLLMFHRLQPAFIIGGSSSRLSSYPSFQPSHRFSPNRDRDGGGLL